MSNKSFFTSFFDSISDVETKFNFNNEMRTKLIEDRYFNVFKGKTSFPAIILHHNFYNAGGTYRSSGGKFIIAKVRPLDLHTFILPHPCRDCVGGPIAGNGSISATKLKWMQSIIGMHPTAYSESKKGATQNVPKIGETVECFFQEQGPEFEGRMRGIRFRNTVLSGKPGNYEYKCLEKINDDFAGGSNTSINTFRNNTDASSLLGSPDVD